MGNEALCLVKENCREATGDVEPTRNKENEACGYEAEPTHSRTSLDKDRVGTGRSLGEKHGDVETLVLHNNKFNTLLKEVNVKKWSATDNLACLLTREP